MTRDAGGLGSGSGQEDDRALHARLLRRESTAPSDLADRHLTPLIASLRRAFPRRHFPDVNDALIETVAIDVMLDVAERPERVDLAVAARFVQIHW